MVKRVSAALLCFALVTSGFSQTTNAPAQSAGVKPQGFFLAGFVLSALAAGGYMIYKLASVVPPPYGTLVAVTLEESTDGGKHWTAIAVTLMIMDENPQKCFQIEIDKVKPCVLHRVRVASA
jgi:hypothetical protein